MGRIFGVPIILVGEDHGRQGARRMKAKEYYGMFLRDEKESGEIRAFANLINKYFAEVKDIVKARMKGRLATDSTMIAVFKEQNRKWNAMRKFDPRFNRDGFMEFAKHRMPMLKDFL